MMYINFCKKKMSGRGPSGVSKLTFLRFGILSGFGCRIFVGFQVVSTHYPVIMTPYPLYEKIDVII
jgi:hypothetical protein